ncbi:MAG TPA: class I SAM-dependent methyltransferase [Glaciibacter sp.]|nr:class I SAM-dependent methyltransferase [Glaciibacter sp.]
MDGPAWIRDTSYWKPRHLVPSAWHEHAPFAYWLVDAIRPASIVELGTHSGFSYFVFCEAVTRLGLNTRTWALDTWEGDDHAGFYGEDVFTSVSSINAGYAQFSTLLRGYFDDSLDSFEDGSVDLLHIDGRHGYDDVRHDFETWLPKMSARGVVILHDIAEHQEGFGVWRLWDEISERYPSFAFAHGHGLGVLAVGSHVPEALLSFLDSSPDRAEAVRSVYEDLGAAVSLQYSVELQAARTQPLCEHNEEADQQLARAAERIHDLQQQIDELRSSTSWRVTAPLRAVGDIVRRLRR